MSSDAYKFDIVNGQVTAAYELDDGVWELEPIDDDGGESYAVAGNGDVLRTKIESYGTEITRYADADSDGVYFRIAESLSPSGNFNRSNKAFKFDVANGQVTAAYELDDGQWELKSLDDDGGESYVVETNGDVVRTEVEPFGTEITRYADTDGDGVYFRVSEQWVISPGSGGVTPKFSGELRYSPTDDDDFIAVRAGEDCRGGRGADDFVIREAAHLRIADFKSLDDDVLVFDTGLGLTSREHLASFVSGIRQDDSNFIVDFGANVSITLIGVASDQISWDDVSVLS
ncbi:MAG TPA: hypothetical protein PKY85_03735 [Nitrosomonas sp.]|nr:hypothetical protein [Nitrosomonas sp.]